VPPPPPPRRKIPRPVIGLFAAIGLFIVWEIFTSYVAYTDDAYVRSDVVALAPEVTGHLTAVNVVDEQHVHRGDVLASIDPVPFQLAVNAGQAALRQANADAAAAADSVTAAHDQFAAAQAQLANAQITNQRQSALGQSGFASRTVQDNALAALRTTAADASAKQAMLANAQAQLAADQAAIAHAQATLDLAQWQLARTNILAPVDGVVTNMNLRRGDTAQANTPLIGIIADSDWRIIANYKQSYLPGLHPGATAWVWLDANPWHLYRARIRSIGRAIARGPGDDGLLPYVAPTTDWIRLQHRFPVTIDLVNPPPGLTLYMGADARCLIFP
jgi:multidrug efflux system membrane fusion protein